MQRVAAPLASTSARDIAAACSFTRRAFSAAKAVFADLARQNGPR